MTAPLSAIDKLNVAAGAAALAQLAELDPFANDKVEAEIPDNLKEQPPPESLFALDKRMAELQADIRALHEQRHKDYHNISGRRDRLGAFQPVSAFERFKQLRSERLEKLLNVEMPVRLKSSSQQIAEELETYWNVDRELDANSLFLMLMDFFKSKATQLVEQNALLLSRWSRFCRTSYDISTFFPTFQRYQEWLQGEYTDAVDRYERLANQYERQQRKMREEEARAEAERIERERRGILPGAKKVAPRKSVATPAKPNGNDAETASMERSASSFTTAQNATPFGPSELGSEPLFEVGDMVVFLRWAISTGAARKNVEMFLQRARMLVHSDRIQLIKDYRLINEVKPSQGAMETLNVLEGINNYIEKAPLRNPRIEDFLTEFDLLVAHWNLETPIAREDGRAFAHEVDLKFRDIFERQAAEASFPPYETVSTGAESDITTGAEGRAGSAGLSGGAFNGGNNAPAPDSKASLAALSGLLSHPGYKNHNVPRLRHADWVEEVEFRPDLDQWHEAQVDFLEQRRDIDFELRYEHDLVMTNDTDVAIARLKESARRIYEASSAITPSGWQQNNRPASGRQQKQQKQQQDDHQSGGAPIPVIVPGTVPSTKAFELGMKVPDPQDMELAKDFRVLDGKKHAFGMLLRQHAEKQKVEQEIAGGAVADGKGGVNGDATISALFSEHEIYCFLQLRHLRLRDLRKTLLSQLNFFRSVEKRVNREWIHTKARVNVEATDPTKYDKDRGRGVLGASAVVTHMWHQQELFDMPDPAAERARDTNGNRGAAVDQTGGTDSSTEDLRQLVEGVIVTRDNRGTPFIYDSAMEDLKSLETRLLKIATIYINTGSSGNNPEDEDTPLGLKELEAERKYAEDMRFRLSERKDVADRNYTFLNPALDRAQLLLEMYDQEVKFQYAKLEVVNAYMEVYEHTTDPVRIRRMGQIITDIMHTRPTFDFESPYFSRSYSLAIKSLQLQAWTILPMVKNGIERYRDWIQRYFGRIDATGARDVEIDEDCQQKQESTPQWMQVGVKKIIDSPLIAGLPPKDDTERRTVTMHHASVILNMTEMIPELDMIMDVYDSARESAAEMGRTLQGLSRQAKGIGLGDLKKRAKKKVDRLAIECAIWKGYYNIWQSLSDHQFKVPQPRHRRLIGQLDAELWVENPLLPDLVLMDYYPIQEARDRERELKVYAAAMTPFTDIDFRSRGNEVCQRTLKILLLKERLFFCWLETEYWRKTYESLFRQMSISKATYTGRLNPLKFDLPDMADNTAVEEDDEEAPDAADHNAAVSGASGSDNEEERETSAISTAAYHKLGPLAVSELDEEIADATMTATARGAFDFASFPGVKAAMRPEGVKQLRLSLKIQLVEKYWHTSAVELHNMLLGEIHTKLLIEGDAPKVEKKVPGRRSPQRYANTSQLKQQTLEVDYKLLVTSIVPKKKVLRKLMLTEYGNQLKMQSLSNISEPEREGSLATLRSDLVEWYYNNMVEIALEECERADYAKLMMEFKTTVLSTTYGKLLFRPSKVQRHFDYFANQDKGITDVEVDPSKLTMDGVQTQEVVQTEMLTIERICKLWYLPHLTEIIMNTHSTERLFKGVPDLSQRAYRNNGVLKKAFAIQAIMMDVFIIVGAFAHLLQDNRRYAVQVRQVREADYAVNILNAMKKDLSYQGPQIEHSRVEQYLLGKWQLWILKLRLTLASSMYTLGMNLMRIPYGTLLSHHFKTLRKEHPIEEDHFRTLTKISRLGISFYDSPYPSPFIFGALDEKAKRLCDKKVLELEECLDEFLQATMLNFGENTEEINKSQSDFLLTGLKLLALRRSFLKQFVPGGMVKTEEQLRDFFRVYKMRVLVPAVRMYHRLGAKGNASIPLLLRDEMVTATVDFDFNRIAQASFDKCQSSVLQTELLREYTIQLLRQARAYYDRLADERTGRLFKVYESIEVPSTTGEKAFTFRLTEEDYTAKAAMINEFVRDIYKANATFMREVQDTQKASGPKGVKTTANVAVNQVLDENRVFACTKDLLGQAITMLALQLSKWQEKRRGEQEHFMGTLMSRMLEMIRNGEKLVRFLAQEKKELLKSYKRDVRLLAFQLSSDLHADFASTSVELAELRKQRKIDERKVRNRILDEYDDLVHELVMEINVLRNRFSEYRINTFQEVMTIMGEAKKEELQVVIDNREMPENMRESAAWMMRHENEAQELRQENHELKMTLVKLRSMYVIKEQSLRSSYEKRTRKLTGDSKTAEEKLWDSYREAEARERALRRQLTKAQKMLSMKEAENDNLQRQLREEQQRVRQLTPIKDRSSARRYADSDTARIAELQERLRRYEMLNIDAIVQELNDKTRLLEQMLDERKKTGGMAGGMVGKRQAGDYRRRAVSARLARPPMVIKAIAPRRKGLGPYSEYRESIAPTAEEETLSGPGQKMEKDINDHLVRKVNSLAMQNKQMRQMLSDFGVHMPEFDSDSEEEKMEVRKEREVRKSVMWEDQKNDVDDEARREETRKPIRALQSAPPGGRTRDHAQDMGRSTLYGDTATGSAPAGDKAWMPPIGNIATASTPPPLIGSWVASEQDSRMIRTISPSPSHGDDLAQDTERPSGSARGYRTAPRFADAPLILRHSTSKGVATPKSGSGSVADMTVPSVLRTTTPPPLPQQRPSSSRPSSRTGTRPTPAPTLVGQTLRSSSDIRLTSSRPTTPRT